MKHIALTSLLFASLTLSAQMLVDDFETNVQGWMAENGANAFVADNPLQEGLNLSCKTYCIERPTHSVNWAAALLRFAEPVRDYKYVHVLMYRNNTGTPNLKVSDANPKDLSPMDGITIVANQWQDVVFDISYLNGAGAEFLYVMPDRGDLLEDAKVYMDDVLFSNDATPRTTPNEKCDIEDQEPEDANYTLVWNADFTEHSLNSEAWNIEVNGDGGGNNELQYYCEKGVSLGVEPTTGKHCLILTATREDYKGKTCTSGRVNSLGKVYFQYGKVEARIFFPQTANGLWPAFWMMGNDYPEVGWPACGETDIIELGHQNGIKAGTQDRFFNGASHWGPRWDKHYQYAQDITNPYSVEDGFHTITCIWDAEHVAMYVDMDTYPNAKPYYQMTIPESSEDNAPGKYFHKPNFIIFNLAVGGNFPGIWDINAVTALQSGARSMYVDYVRVYQRGVEGESFVSNVPSDPIEEEPMAIVNPEVEQQVQKVFRNGRLYLIRNGVAYDVLGNKQ